MGILPQNEQKWSKSYPFKPKHNLKSHVLINEKAFKASYEKDPHDPPSMSLILAGEYARIWQREHCDFVKKQSKKKNLSSTGINALIVKRFNKWSEVHRANKSKLLAKRYCCSIGIK